MNKQPFLIHNHSETSNFRLLDSINKTTHLLDKAVEMGLSGICITDHETVSSHVRAFQHIQKNPDKFKDFKVGYGNEIYLIHEEDSNRAKENNERIKYHHFVLVAKDEKGHEGIRQLSSQAWLNSYTHKGMQRVPLFYHQLEEVMKEYKGHIIGSTACLGGVIPQLALKANGYSEDRLYLEDKKEEGEEVFNETVKNLLRFRGEKIEKYPEKNVDKLNKILQGEVKNSLIPAQNELKEKMRFFINTFGKDDFYIELQPSHRRIQTVANKLLYELAKEYGIKPIVTTDTHYLDEDRQVIHQAYLNSKDGDREVADFYSTTFLMDYDKLREYFNKELLDELVENTLEIESKIEPIEFGRKIQIPEAHIPDSFSKDYIKFFSQYPEYKHIHELIKSDNEQNQYYLYLIHKGILDKRDKLLKNYTIETIIHRIDLEMEQIILLSEYFGQPMSGYFLFVKELVDLIWKVSLVAPNRGSAASWITNYLIDITQVNPLDFDIPYWRFLHIERGAELPDMNNVCTLFTQNEVYAV